MFWFQIKITNINQYVKIIIIQLLPYLVFLIKSNQCQSNIYSFDVYQCQMCIDTSSRQTYHL